MLMYISMYMNMCHDVDEHVAVNELAKPTLAPLLAVVRHADA